MKKLKQFKDGQQFTKTVRRTNKKVVYTLNTLIKSSKKAVYTADKSQITFVRSWDELAQPV